MALLAELDISVKFVPGDSPSLQSPNGSPSLQPTTPKIIPPPGLVTPRSGASDSEDNSKDYELSRESCGKEVSKGTVPENRGAQLPQNQNAGGLTSKKANSMQAKRQRRRHNKQQAKSTDLGWKTSKYPDC